MMIGSSDPTLQVMAERRDTRQLDIADCEKISRSLSDMLDLADPIDGSYRLEVSSPGIDRPLTRIKDYSDWKGHEARLHLAEAHEGRKNFTGTLQGTEGEEVLILTKTGEAHALRFSEIASGKLLLTDKLINATAPLSTEGADTIETVEE
jgi:ribosome maturation factor RimP